MAHLERLALRPLRSKALLPVFLCPILGKPHHVTPTVQQRVYESKNQSRHAHFDTVPTSSQSVPLPSLSQLHLLPRSCPGCGAFTQSVDSDQAGFYSINRKSVKAYIAQGMSERRNVVERDIYEKSLERANPSLVQELGPDDVSNPPKGVLPYSPDCYID